MIKKENEIGVKAISGLQGGSGDALFHIFMSKEEAYQTGRMFAKVELVPGSSIGVHEHHGEFEAYYILKGQALVTDNGRGHVLSAGDFEMCRDGDSHGIACHGDEPVEFIALILSVLEK